jgi:gamma-glutamylcyclotransferase (GGCT)/AIG2-like uncharacterized protein YtfP
LASERLFVYGTLKPGESNAKELAAIPGEWCRATIRGRLVEIGWGANLGFPGLVIDEAGDEVPGYVLESGALAAEWPRLDAFEGEGYERVVACVMLESGETVTAHVYVVDPAGEPAG